MRRRRLIGIYRGLRKSIGCRDSVKLNELGGGGPGDATQTNLWTCPPVGVNLADRFAEHNRRTPRWQTATMPRFRHVDLWIPGRYARQDFPCGTAVNNEANMSTFDKREEGFEKKFALDEELLFKANARRNKLLGLWAAEKLGISGDAANAYAREVVAADFEEAGDGNVLRKVAGDFAQKGVAISEAEVRAKMSELMAVAAAQVKSGT